MGWLDKEDLKCWINLIIEENKDAEIILHGSSMGAATVLMISGDELPANVKSIINIVNILKSYHRMETIYDHLRLLPDLLLCSPV